MMTNPNPEYKKIHDSTIKLIAGINSMLRNGHYGVFDLEKEIPTPEFYPNPALGSKYQFGADPKPIKNKVYKK